MSKIIRRNYRSKYSDSEDEADNGNVIVGLKTEIEHSNILSFGDEFDDTETFKVKKSTHIKKDIKESRKKNKKTDITDNDKEENLKVNEKVKSESNINSDEDPEELYSLIPRGEIPSAEDIDRLKKKKEQAKQRMNKKKDIPTDEIRTMCLNFEIESNSELLNHKDISRFKKHGKTIEMIGPKRPINDFERQKFRNNFLEIEHGNNDNSDEDNQWENRQIMNALNKSVPNTKPNNSQFKWTQSNHIDTDNINKDSKVLSEINNTNAEELTNDKLSKLLIQRRNEIMANSEAVKEQIKEKIKEKDEKLLQIQSTELEIPQLEAQYNVINNFKQYIFILVECFDNKVEQIQYLEGKYMKFYEDRADKLLKRVRHDIQDQSDEMMLRSSGGSIQSTFEQTSRASRIAEKESRRLRRAKLREQQQLLHHQGLHHHGLSSDDEEPKSILLNRQNEIDQLMVERDQLFNDTDIDYHCIESILDKFQELRQKYPVEYLDAFINGFLPHILSPLIRLEILAWNPLETPRFDKWAWFKTLVDYTKRNISGDEQDFDHNSLEFSYLKLIPMIFDKIIVAKLIDWAAIWNPISTRETNNLVKFVGKLVSQFPTINHQSGNLQKLIKSLANRINESIAEDIFVPFNIDVYQQSPNGPEFQFFNRQIWSTIKTFCNIMSWSELMNSGLLSKLALDGILNSYIITGLSVLIMMQQPSAVISMLQSIIKVMPVDWFNQDGTTPTVSTETEAVVTSQLSERLEPFTQLLHEFGVTFQHDRTSMEFILSTMDHFNIDRTQFTTQMKKK